ncbi:MAG: phosphoribosylanthranilate isomerase [Terriglobales bacterium]
MTWVKICGTTSIEDALVAVEAGADALGFVFAKSPRRVTPQAARTIIAELPATVERVGVFVNETAERIQDIARDAGLTGAQLHGDETAGQLGDIRSRLSRVGSAARILLAWRLAEFPPVEGFGLDLPAGDERPDCLLLDSQSPISRGGTSTRFDWKSWGSFLDGRLRRALPPLIVAGGLNPENVTEAIHLLHPWGVDVVSGVEREPGKKDPGKVRAFLAAVREADKEHTRP